MNAHTVKVTDATFDEVVGGSETPVLVDFWAEWCGPCHLVAPVLDELAAERAGDLVVAKLDVDGNPGTARRFGVMSIPTLILFREGEEVDRLVGAVPKPALEARLAAVLGEVVR